MDSIEWLQKWFSMKSPSWIVHKAAESNIGKLTIRGIWITLWRLEGSLDQDWRLKTLFHVIFKLILNLMSFSNLLPSPSHQAYRNRILKKVRKWANCSKLNWLTSKKDWHLKSLHWMLKLHAFSNPFYTLKLFLSSLQNRIRYHILLGKLPKDHWTKYSYDVPVASILWCPIHWCNLE